MSCGSNVSRRSCTNATRDSTLCAPCREVAPLRYHASPGRCPAPYYCRLTQMFDRSKSVRQRETIGGGACRRSVHRSSARGMPGGDARCARAASVGGARAARGGAWRRPRLPAECDRVVVAARARPLVGERREVDDYVARLAWREDGRELARSERHGAQSRAGSSVGSTRVVGRRGRRAACPSRGGSCRAARASPARSSCSCRRARRRTPRAASRPRGAASAGLEWARAVSTRGARRHGRGARGGPVPSQPSSLLPSCARGCCTVRAAARARARGGMRWPRACGPEKSTAARTRMATDR